STRLEGRWRLKSFVYKYYINDELQYPSDIHTTDNRFMVFDNGKYSSYNKNDEIVNQGTYLLRETNLTITGRDMSATWQIKWINKDEFSISNRFDISVSEKEYEIIAFTYVRNK